MTAAVDKWPACARLLAVAPAGHLSTAPTPPPGARPRERSHSTSCTPVARRPDCRVMRCLSPAEQRATRQVKQGFHADACRCTPNTQIVLSPAHRTEYSTAPSGARRPGHVLSSRTGRSRPATAAANPGEQRQCGSPVLSACFACICMHLRETLACFAACPTLLGGCRMPHAAGRVRTAPVLRRSPDPVRRPEPHAPVAVPPPAPPAVSPSVQRDDGETRLGPVRSDNYIDKLH